MTRAVFSLRPGATALQSSAPAHPKAQLLDGRALAREILRDLHRTMVVLQQTYKRIPQLVLINVGDAPAARHYLHRKMRQAQQVGIRCELVPFPVSITQQELLAYLDELNRRSEVSGILVQLPLPSHLCATTILSAIAPEKDVDGLNPWNLGKIFSRCDPPLPCLPRAVIELLHRYAIALQGKRVVILGDDPLVGRALAMLLLRENATVTVCPWHHPALPQLARAGDILITTGGQPRRVTASLVRPAAVVIDAGMNYEHGQVIGDVDIATVARVATALAPTPGGVGPLIVTTLLHNTLAVFIRQHAIPWPVQQP